MSKNRKSTKDLQLFLRRSSALDRQAEHNKLTPQQKLDKLDNAGHRATIERARLAKQLKKVL